MATAVDINITLNNVCLILDAKQQNPLVDDYFSKQRFPFLLLTLLPQQYQYLHEIPLTEVCPKLARGAAYSF